MHSNSIDTLPSEQMYQTQLSQREKETSDQLQSTKELKETLESQMEVHRETHQKQLQNLREDVAAKQAIIDTLKE